MHILDYNYFFDTDFYLYNHSYWATKHTDTPVHLLIHATVHSANHVVAVQGIKSYR